MPDEVILPQRVTKVMVIGLGSAGTSIACTLAQRLMREYGGLEQAPWVRFFCLETNAREPHNELVNDFYSMGIDKLTYTQMRTQPGNFKNIRLDRWVDTQTLEKLPDGEVASGAGNIRMVGRLAFLATDNFTNIRRQIELRLRELRALSEEDARARRGRDLAGRNPGIEFAKRDGIHIYVVGSLCGGTCSGLSPDMGVFLSTVATSDDRITGIFTLPHTQFSPVHKSTAERLKTNARCALEELNMYANGEKRQEVFPVFYPDGTSANSGGYGDIFLAAPDEPTQEAQTNTNIAEFLFLQVTHPEIDSTAKAIDIPVVATKGWACSFSLFGYGALEFPANQVMAGCEDLARSSLFREWRSISMNPAEIDALRQKAGLDLVGFISTISQVRSPSIEEYLRERQGEILKAAESTPQVASRIIDEVRNAFSTRKIIDGNTSGISRKLLDGAKNRLYEFIRSELVSSTTGIKPLLLALKKGKEELLAINTQKRPENSSERTAVNAAVNLVIRIKEDRLLKAVSLQKPAMRDAVPELRSAVQKEFDMALRILAFDILTESDHGGVINPLVQYIELIERRLERLDLILINDSRLYTAQYETRTKTAPKASGIALFDTRKTNEDGTIEKEFEGCIKRYFDDNFSNVESLKKKLLQEMMTYMKPVAEAVAEQKSTMDGDTLLAITGIDGESLKIPSSYLTELNDFLRIIFSPIFQTNIVDRWHRVPDRQTARDMVSQSANAAIKMSLQYDPSHDIPHEYDRVMLPEGAADAREQLKAQIVQIIPLGGVVDTPHKYRIAFLTHRVRLRLDQITNITRTGGLCEATSTDFPTFYTRRDITPQKFEPHRLQAENTGLFAMGVLLDLIRMEDSQFKFVMNKVGVEREGKTLIFKYREDHKFHIGDMAIKVRDGKDSEGHSTDGIVSSLNQRIEHLITTMTGGRETIVQTLKDKMSDPSLNVIVDRGDIGRYLNQYLTAQPEWLAAMLAVLKPSEEKLSLIRRTKSEGGSLVFDKYVCPRDQQVIGDDDESAARKGWRCPQCSTYYGPEY